MEIKATATYKVTKYTGNATSDLGYLSGADVKKILKGYAWDEMFEMFYSAKGTIGYDIKEA